MDKAIPWSQCCKRNSLSNEGIFIVFAVTVFSQLNQEISMSSFQQGKNCPGNTEKTSRKMPFLQQFFFALNKKPLKNSTFQQKSNFSEMFKKRFFNSYFVTRVWKFCLVNQLFDYRTFTKRIIPSKKCAREGMVFALVVTGRVQNVKNRT